MDDFSEQLSEILSDYADEVRKAVNSTTEEAAKELRSAITKDAPVDTGKQKKSWKIQKTMLGSVDLKAVVHSTDYTKVHLLENGHVTRDGVTRTKALHYVGNNAERVLGEYPEQVAAAIRTVK